MSLSANFEDVSAHSHSLGDLLASAERHLANYLRLTATLSHENKGIRRSEMFFLYASLGERTPPRIIESGRARAQSTLVLATLFPETPIISLESDAASPDVAIAAERLKNCANVDCRFGDSLTLLPELVENGDVVLIDGPKDFRALKLALALLKSGKPPMVFVHDLWRGSPPRNFIDTSVPSALLSDHPEWVRRYCHLDRATPPEGVLERPFVYGATLGRFDVGAEDYSRRLRQCSMAQGAVRLRDNVAKFWRATEHDRPKDFAVVSQA